MAEVTNSLDEEISIFFRCACFNAMTQVHYMSSRTGLFQDFFSAFLDSVSWFAIKILGSKLP
jgi:hypothetical protein